MSDNSFDDVFYIKQSEWESFGEYCQFLEEGAEKDMLDEILKHVKNSNAGDPSELKVSKFDYEIIKQIALAAEDWRIKINEDKQFRDKVLGKKGEDKIEEAASKEPGDSEAQHTANEDAYKSAPDGGGLIFVSGSCFDHRAAHAVKTYNYFKGLEHAQKFIDWYTEVNGDTVSHFEFKFKYDNNEMAFELYRNNPYGNNIIETYADCALRNSRGQPGIDLKFRLFIKLKDALELSMAFYTEIMAKKNSTIGETKEAIKKKFGVIDKAYKNKLGWMFNQKERMDTLICDIEGLRADFDVYKDGDNVFVDALYNGDCEMIGFYHTDIKEVVKIVAGIVGKAEQAGLGYEAILNEINEKSRLSL